MYLHGAVVLVLHGDISVDVITSMGFRSPSNTLFRVESTNRPNELVTISLDASVGRDGRRQLVSLLGSDDDSDDDDDGGGGTEVQAVVAIVDMLEALGEEFNGSIDALLDTAVLAVARDSGRPSEELGPDDFELVQLEGLREEFGMLVLGDQLRKGDRFKVMVRDETAMKEELRERILAYKRKDLQAMLSSSGDLPPTFGCIMFTDVDRGMAMYKEASYEARMLSTYLPTPISGLFGGGQIARFNETHTLMENVCVAGVLRASEPSAKQGASGGPPTAASAAAYARSEGLLDPDASLDSSDGEVAAPRPERRGDAGEGGAARGGGSSGARSTAEPRAKDDEPAKEE
uniref:FIST C-domain domain-containing protein n=1 Tax=Chlamydomonas euryale TaxID=1486919 RepID=A0A7R9YT89_9CHLO